LISLDEQTTQRRFALLVGVSEKTVSLLLDRGVLARDATLGEWLRAYCAHMREKAAERAACGDLDLATERAALARSMREKIDMQNLQTRRRFAPPRVLDAVLAATGRRVAGVLDCAHLEIARRMPDLPAEARAVIKTEIAKARDIAAGMSLRMLDDDAADE
jgi:terminase small subunit / prophage DNA-packing protein